MPLKILIDANIYLNFFEQKSSGFKKLLDSIAEIKAEIFVSKQISDEVLRGKLRVSIRSIKQVFQGFNVKGARFPEGFKTQEVLDWNLKISAFEKAERELIDIGLRVVEAVANSTDPVSIALDQIFSEAKSPTSTQVELASKRKSLGNPPGKAGDPIGDQLTWVQFLSEITANDVVFIVSYDGDYFEKLSDREFYLNPFLLAELKGKGVSESNIRFFTSLALALEEIKKVKPTIVIPDIDTRKEIEKEEAEVIRILNTEAQRRTAQYLGSSYPEEINSAFSAHQAWLKRQMPSDVLDASKLFPG